MNLSGRDFRRSWAKTGAAFLTRRMSYPAIHPLCVIAAIMLLSANLHAFDDLKNYSFSIASASSLTSATHRQNVVTSLGPAEAWFDVYAGSVSGTTSGISAIGPGQGGGGFGIRYLFAQPVDLTDRDFFRIIQSHSTGRNRIEGIYIGLTDLTVLQLRSVFHAPFLDNQNQYALYNFDKDPPLFVFRPKSVAYIAIRFVLPASETILVKSLSLEALPGKLPLKSLLARGTGGELFVQSDRSVGTNEIVRLEASYDLVKWFPKTSYTQGTNGIVSLRDRPYEAAKFYRLHSHLIVQPVGPTNN